MAEVDLLDFVKTNKRLVRQASGTNAGESTNGLARWKHVIIHCYRLEDDHIHSDPSSPWPFSES
ncbi:ISH9-type transposase [Halococcus thailandensis JCM 13552]|uniref:ISH9-type transposase n=1 Tax=Halococcus thailandensis JCM 13552 TaxID=1227457 RepID=M0NFJ9_9EURY|nr:ISH9-type transposase [Halococcus thailandensis JCM 13552]